LVAFQSLPGGSIHRPAESDPDAVDVVLPNQRIADFPDLSPDAFGAFFGPDLGSFQGS